MSQPKRNKAAVVTMLVILAGSITMVAAAYQIMSKNKGGKDKKADEQVEKLPPSEAVLRLRSNDTFMIANAMKSIKENWDDRYLPMLVEIQPYVHEETREDVRLLLSKHYEVAHGSSDPAWFLEVWKRPENVFDDYADFKKVLYSTNTRGDPRFAEYFDKNRTTTIRLDEVQFGGVKRDGIPPLKNPKTIEASKAKYLDDSNVVFGVVMNGKARAYPKRILAWHEMVKDVVGGKSINGVYCTLCGSMIVYDTNLEGKHYELGTSGFLYRSNKLMYDKDTKSLWSTITGEPVIGPLVGQNIKLNRLTVVTTTWGKWRELHPDSTVLSLDTGFERDYGEGVAYKSYFDNDRLMFEVSQKKNVLPNKEPVLALRFGEGDKEVRVAITIKHLKKLPVFHSTAGGQAFVVLTDKTGAARVYETGGNKFSRWNEKDTVETEKGKKFTVHAEYLEAEDGTRLNRLPSHNAFWFGWYAAYPDTRLIGN